jgi:hypothetical protein
MTDEKKTDKPEAGTKSAAADSASKSAARTTDASQKSAAGKKPAAAADDKATAGKAAPKKKVPAKKLSEADKKAADDSIRSRQSIEELKARAAAAKKRAQEKILEKSYVSDPPVDPLERLADTFDNSARRWEMVVYPSLFAFVLLAGYGFFLIYRLTHDISTLSQSVTRMAVIVSDAMPRMTKDLNVMTDSMDNMTGNIANMSGDIDGMSTEMSSMSTQMNTLTPMSNNIQSMTHNIGSMNRSVYGMQRDMHGMNRTVSSGPFGMMNDMLPFSSDSNVPPPLPPAVVWPSYQGVPQQANPYPQPGQAYSQQPGMQQPGMQQWQPPARPASRTASGNLKQKPTGRQMNDATRSTNAKSVPADAKLTSKAPARAVATKPADKSSAESPAREKTIPLKIPPEKQVQPAKSSDTESGIMSDKHGDIAMKYQQDTTTIMVDARKASLRH